MAKMNVTTEDLVVDSFEYYFALLAIPLCVLGLFGNTLSVLIFLSRQFRICSINILLGCLAIYDWLLLFASIPLFLPVSHLPDWLYICSVLYLYPLGLIFHCSSIWLLVAITYERWTAVCRPLMVARYCTRKRACAVVAFVSVLSVILNACRFWDARIKWFSNGVFDFETLLQANDYYVFWYKTVFKTSVLYVAPLGVITLLNTLIIRQMRLAQKARSHMSVEQAANQRTSLMLFYLILFFIVSYCPCLVLNVVDVLDRSVLKSNAGPVLLCLNNGLVVLNAATTALFYLYFSSRYRRAARYYLCCTDSDNQPRFIVRQQRIVRKTPNERVEVIRVQEEDEALSDNHESLM